MSHYRLLAGALVAIATIQTACAFDLVFLYPTEDLTFYYLDTINVEYQSNFSSPSLYTWCYDSDKIVEERVDSVNGGNATASIQLNFTTGAYCWFDLKESANIDAGGFNSAVWDFVNTQRSQTTLGLSTSTSASATNAAKTTAVSTSSKGSTTATAAATSDAASNSGLSTGSKAGIGAGVGIAGIAAIAIVAVFLLKRQKGEHDRKKSDANYRTHSNQSAYPPQPSYNSPESTLQNSKANVDNSQNLAEMPQPHAVPGSAAVPQEMDAPGPSVYELPATYAR